MSRLLYFISLFNILTNHLTSVDKFYETKDFTKKKRYIFFFKIFSIIIERKMENRTE